jgi:hypothetical protein
MYGQLGESMSVLTANIKHFASLNRATGATWTEATKHKPLLLSV